LNVSSPSVPALNMTTNVGSYKANSLGLHDMHGNVREWCLDWEATYQGGSVTNPLGPNAGTARVIRGGSYADGGWLCRSAVRDQGASPDTTHDNLGFRIVLA